MRAPSIVKAEIDSPASDNPILLDPNIRVDFKSRLVLVRNVLHRKNSNPWQSTRVEEALLPPTAYDDQPTRLVDNDVLFDTYVCGLNMYASRHTESKSLHTILKAWSRVFIKTAEFAWVNSFYDLRDVPEPLWEQLHRDIADGGWCQALQIESRVVKFLSSTDRRDIPIRVSKKAKRLMSVKTSVLSFLGTNISGRELVAIKNLALQAAEDEGLRKSGDIERYQLHVKARPSSGVVRGILGSLEVLAQIEQKKAILKFPRGSRYAFAMQNQGAQARTKNIDPIRWAKVLMHSYKWIFDHSPSIVSFVGAFAKSQQQLLASGAAIGRGKNQKYNDRSLCLESLPEAKLLGANLGLEVTSFLKSNSSVGEISVNTIILNLYISCFVVLVSMNARRKDEVIGSSIGLHVDSFRKIDETFGINGCEFYMEKGIRDYRVHSVNDVTSQALKVMMAISNVAWWLCDDPTKPTTGRDRKLFLMPNFTEGGREKWFTFNSDTLRDTLSKFLKTATGENMHLTPHMLRRGYGILYYYRYENAQLVALAQKYGHIDLAQALHYVTDSPNTPHEKTAVAKWASPSRTLARGEKSFDSEVADIIHEVGVEKIKIYVSEVVDSSRTFSGGFAKLVARFHRKLGALVRYTSLDQSQKKEQVANAVIARGHNIHPYPWGNCMAGSSRKHSACTTGSGDIARENASPTICGSCPYSDTGLVHLQNLEAEVVALESQFQSMVGTLRELTLSRELKSLKRIIELHRIRLGVAL